MNHVHFDLDALERQIRGNLTDNLKLAYARPDADPTSLEIQSRAVDVIVALCRWHANELQLQTEPQAIYGCLGILAGRVINIGKMNLVNYNEDGATYLETAMMLKLMEELTGTAEMVGKGTMEFHGEEGGRA